MQLPQRGAQLRLRVQAGVDTGGEGLGEVRAVLAKRGKRLADLPRRVGGGRPRHGIRSRPQLEQRQGERVRVRPLVGGLALGLLRRHVGERPDHLAGRRQSRRAGQRRDPEVHQLRLSADAFVGAHDHVLGLDVPVDHTTLVGVGQRLAEVRAELRGLAIAETLGRASSASVAPSTSSLTSSARPSSEPSS